MIHLRRLLASLFALLVVGCDDDGAVSSDAGGGAQDASSGDAAYVVGSRIRTPSGRTFFVSVEPDLAPRQIDLSRSIELSGFARTYTANGAVFVMDSESLEKTPYPVDGELRLQPDGRLAMSGLGFNRFRLLFAFVSPTRAYYVDTEQLQVVVWNPMEMTIDGIVPLEGVARDDLDIRVTGLQVVGDRIFAPIGWTDEVDFRALPTVGLIVLDAETGQTEGVFEDSRCAVAGGAFADAAGDLYVLGDSADGRYEFFGTADLPPPCLLRVRGGASDFDPNFYVDMEQLTGSPAVGHLIGLPNGTAVTRVLGTEIDVEAVENPFDLTTAEIWQWTLLDVPETGASPLNVPLSALPFPPFVVDGTLIVPREASTGTSTLYRVEGGEAQEGLTVVGEYLQLDRIR